MWNQKMEGDKATWSYVRLLPIHDLIPSKAKQSVFGSRKPSALLSPGIPVPMFKVFHEVDNRAVRNVGKQNSAGSGPLLEPINQSAMRGWDLNWLDN
uniref:Uncharacterized protein n=1 Tax=Pyricularia oryzae (strain P131) TaxID=1143193 RepID=L7JQU4_PYRO1